MHACKLLPLDKAVRQALMCFKRPDTEAAFFLALLRCFFANTPTSFVNAANELVAILTVVLLMAQVAQYVSG